MLKTEKLGNRYLETVMLHLGADFVASLFQMAGGGAENDAVSTPELLGSKFARKSNFMSVVSRKHKENEKFTYRGRWKSVVEGQ